MVNHNDRRNERFNSDLYPHAYVFQIVCRINKNPAVVKRKVLKNMWCALDGGRKIQS